MRRNAFIAASLAVALGTLPLTACARKVTVKTGERYVCTYGEAAGEDVREVQVPAAEASKYSIVTKTITCPRHRNIEMLYALAQAAIKSGDLKTAKKNLAQVIAIDAGYKRASGQLADIRKGKKPALDPSKPGPSPGNKPKPEDTPSSPAMDAFRGLVPDKLTGFTAEAIVAEDLSLTRAYVPVDRSRSDQLVIMIQQYQSSAGVRQALDARIKPTYGVGWVSVTVAKLKGYFGTDGSQFAVLSLDRSGVMVTFELHATKGKPGELRSDLERIAAEVLD